MQQLHQHTNICRMGDCAYGRLLLLFMCDDCRTNVNYLYVSDVELNGVAIIIVVRLVQSSIRVRRFLHMLPFHMNAFVDDDSYGRKFNVKLSHLGNVHWTN